MDVIVNGVAERCRPGSIAQLVADRGLPPKVLIIELNGTIVGQERWSQIPLQDGDRLELLSLVGGG